MLFTFFDAPIVTPAAVKKHSKTLVSYREQIATLGANGDTTQPEYALFHIESLSLQIRLTELKKKFSPISDLVLIGIGGSTLGTEAIHAVLGEKKVRLHVLDTISAQALNEVLLKLKSVKSAKKIAVCVVSKSGSTTETLSNAGVLLNVLSERFGAEIYHQSIFIGNPKTPFIAAGKKFGGEVVTMPEAVGGRYSVFTEVGLVPLTLLQHDVESLIDGCLDANTELFTDVAEESAARISVYLQKKYQHYNFFAFDNRLYALGAWYRQLFAESLGKADDINNKPLTGTMVPTITTPVELHSTGQQFFSGVPAVYTDFVSFDDDTIDFTIPKSGIGKTFARHSLAEISAAMYAGVVAAYQEKQLPYRATLFTENLPYSLGLFMMSRMREVMYVAKLQNINAFNQPNVELYKTKTKQILGL